MQEIGRGKKIFIEEEFEDLKKAVSRICTQNEIFEVSWEHALDQCCKSFAGLPAEASQLNIRLRLLKCLCNEFPEGSLRKAPGVMDVVLEGTAKSGERLIMRGQSWEVIDRRISPRFGVLYKLRTRNGEIMEQEFFD